MPEFDEDAQLDTSQVEDLRGASRRRVPGGGITIGGGGIGLVALIAIVLLNVLGGGGSLGGGLGNLTDETAGTPATNSSLSEDCTTGADANERDDCRIVAYVNSIQRYWTNVFARSNERYTSARTRFFTDAVDTGCGTASSASGPFYCPADRYVYIDLGFFDQLRDQYGASGGPFAQAYVMAHEYGHHVQNLLGNLGRPGEAGAQGRSVRIELQADCFAGAWARNAVATGYLTRLTDEDVADALDAAAAVGDDRIQEATQGSVDPDSWTHGSAAQRQRWFTRGYEAGSPSACDTLSGTI